MNNSEIKTEVESWLLDLPNGATTRIDGWVHEAIRDACRRYNFKFMQAEEPYETANLTRELGEKPERWKESRANPYYYHQDGSTSLMNWAASESDMLRTYAIRQPAEGNEAPEDDGAPRYLLERPDTLDVFPLPDDQSDWNNGNYSVVVPYWRYPVALANDEDENFLTTEAPWYVIFKALSLGFAWNRDEERSMFFERKAERQFKRIERQDKLSNLSGRLNLPVRKDVFAGRSRSGLRG